MKNEERILKAFANKRRLEILKLLKDKKKLTVTDISQKIKLSVKATSQHLSILYKADLTDKEQISLNVYYSLSKSLNNLSRAILVTL